MKAFEAIDKYQHLIDKLCDKQEELISSWESNQELNEKDFYYFYEIVEGEMIKMIQKKLANCSKVTIEGLMGTEVFMKDEITGEWMDENGVKYAGIIPFEKYVSMSLYEGEAVKFDE